MTQVRVCFADPQGMPTPPKTVEKIELSDSAWRQRLTPEQFRITRREGTERPFCGGLLHEKGDGIYACVCCGLPLFASSAKFESGTGWPSFFQPFASENLREEPDHSFGMFRIETRCSRCDAHLGHVFDDGPAPTGRRYCMNSEALRFVPRHRLAELAETDLAPVEHASSATSPPMLAEAVLAGGCFWCVEAVFEELEGVIEAVSGYAGGSAETANYQDVCTGTTGHAEAVKIVYDPRRISYEQLLEVHFSTHDPTTLNRQGNDRGPQYRSAIFYSDDAERAEAEAFLERLKNSGAFSAPIVTTLERLEAFYPAEREHQNYVACNPMQPYVRAVAAPKVQKVRSKFANLIRAH